MLSWESSGADRPGSKLMLPAASCQCLLACTTPYCPVGSPNLFYQLSSDNLSVQRQCAIIFSQVHRYQSLNSVPPRHGRLPPKTESISAQYTYFGCSRLRVSVRMIIWGPQVTGLLGNKAKYPRDREIQGPPSLYRGKATQSRSRTPPRASSMRLRRSFRP